MDEGTKRDGTTAGCPERACGPCINRSDCAREDRAVAETVADGAQANAAVEQFCAAAEALIAATTEAPVLSERTENASCKECRERQANALLRELALRHEAEERMQDAVNRSLNILSERDAVMAERDAALVERDARIADEALRAQRVDVEALRHKVSEMRKMLAAVDGRADERFAVQLRTRDTACEARVAAVRAEVAPALAELDRVRAGEGARREALNAALEMIWAFDRKDRGAAGSHFDLLMHLRNVLSAARVHAQ